MELGTRTRVHQQFLRLSGTIEPQPFLIGQLRQYEFGDRLSVMISVMGEPGKATEECLSPRALAGLRYRALTGTPVHKENTAFSVV